MEIARKQTAVKASDWFTGAVWIETVVRPKEPSRVSEAAVHFTPGARTAWHTHHGGQSLSVTEGAGRVQSHGGQVVTIGPGDVVHAPSGEWHWQGAAPDRLMTHLSITEGPADPGATAPPTRSTTPCRCQNPLCPAATAVS